MKKILLALIVFVMLTSQVLAHEVKNNVTLAEIEGYIFNYDFTSDGNIIAVGGSAPGGFDEELHERKAAYTSIRTSGDTKSTALIMKYASDGKLLDIKTFGGDSYDYFTTAKETKDGGYVAAGYTKSYGGGDLHKHGVLGNSDHKEAALYVKYDKNLQVEWAYINREANYSPYVWEKDDTFYIKVGDELQVINKDGLKVNSYSTLDILGPDVYINNIAMSSTGDFYFIGDQFDGEKSIGILKKTNDKLEEVYTKTFEVDGSIYFYNINLVDDNVIVQASLFRSSLSGDLKNIESDFGSEKIPGHAILIYDKEGNLARGRAFKGGNDYNLISIYYHGQLANHDYIFDFKVREDGMFYDPLTEALIPVKYDNLYIYRFNSQLEAKGLFVVPDNLIEMFEPYIDAFALNDDDSFDLILKTYSGGLKVITIIDKTYLEEVLKRAEDFLQIKDEIEEAMGVLANEKASQAEVNEQIAKLEAAMDGLKAEEKKDNENTPEISPPIEVTPSPEEKDEPKKNNKNVYLNIVVFILVFIGVLLIILIKKRQ